MKLLLDDGTEVDIESVEAMEAIDDCNGEKIDIYKVRRSK
jgi:hypothetical protein